MEQIQSQDKLHIMGIDEYMQMVRREKGIEIGIEKGMEKGRSRNAGPSSKTSYQRRSFPARKDPGRPAH
jgi:hypothetical protein